MKKILIIFLCFTIFTGCASTAETSSNITVESESTALIQPVQTPRDEETISGDAPLHAKKLLYDLVYSDLIYWDLENADGSLIYRLNLYYENCIIGKDIDKFIDLYGTIELYQRDYLAVPAEVYEKHLCDTFGVTASFLKETGNYKAEQNVYTFDTYFHEPSMKPVYITDYSEDDGCITVEYTAQYYNGNSHQRIMQAKQTDNGWQYTANKYNITPPQTEPYPAVNFNTEKLPDIAAALAKHMVEYGRSDNYKLADVKPENVNRLFMTNYIFTFENSKSYDENYPYKNLVKYVDDRGGDIIYNLNHAQMIAYQLYGFENWFVPTTDYNSKTMTYTNPTEIGWGFGPQSRQISAEYVSDSKIKVLIYAENPEAEEKYNFTVYFDVMTEDGNTFLRFNEMTYKYVT